MILTIFRPKRIKNGKPCVARSYRGRRSAEKRRNVRASLASTYLGPPIPNIAADQTSLWVMVVIPIGG